MAHSMKKIWKKPALRTFESPKEAAAYARGRTTGVENEKVEELLECFRGSRRESAEPIVLRGSARR